MKKIIIATAILWATLSGVAQATWHLYLVPVIGQGTEQDERRGKYMENFPTSACMDYGYQPVMLCAANDTTGFDTTMNMQADVARLPDNLDSAVAPAGLAAVQNALEN